MATRDLTKQFFERRNFHLPSKKRKTYEELEEEDQEEQELQYTHAAGEKGKHKLDEEENQNSFADPNIAPPQWVVILNNVREDMTDIKQRSNYFNFFIKK